MSGESGARKRHGAIDATLCGRRVEALRAQQDLGVGGLRRSGSGKPEQHRLQRERALRRAARSWCEQRRRDERLADARAGGGDEDAPSSLARARARARTASARRAHLVLRVRRGEGEAQARGALRHRRRADRRDEEALRARGRALAASAVVASPRTSGTMQLAGSGKPSSRAEVRARSASAWRTSSGVRRDQVERGAGGRDRRRREPGRVDQGARAAHEQRRRTDCGRAQIAAVAADRLRERAHLERHGDLVARDDAAAAARPRRRRARARRRPAATRRLARRALAARPRGARSPSMLKTPSVSSRQWRCAPRSSLSSARSARGRCGWNTATRAPERRAPPKRHECAERVGEDEVACAGEGRHDAEVREVAAAEDERALRAASSARAAPRARRRGGGCPSRGATRPSRRRSAPSPPAPPRRRADGARGAR